MTRTLLTLLLAAVACVPAVAAPAAPYTPQPYVRFQHADWTKNAALYQINTRQFTREGTLRAAARELPRLAELGVDILWLMPIQPIGEQRRMGTLGSPYAVRDYLAVNPELGTLADLRDFVAEAHRLGMRVILDWVGNHTAWDNVLWTSHPDWYVRDAAGKPRPTPWFDWDDIVDLDYDVPSLRRYMTDALKYWVREADIDGYRVDAAGLVPQDFWDHAATELRTMKPVFLLAEWESRDMHARAFDATYAWSWWDALKHIAEGKADATSLYPYYAWNEKFYPREAYRLLYTTNHDKNAWEGTEFEIFGPMTDAAIVFSFVSEGMPLIYNGQEAGNRKRLAFFDRDPIVWQESPYRTLYKKLLDLKHANTALWNGQHGARMVHVPASDPKRVFSFVRQDGANKVFAVFNLSGQMVDARFDGGRHAGAYRDFATGAPVALGADTVVPLAPWSWRLFVAAPAR